MFGLGMDKLSAVIAFCNYIFDVEIRNGAERLALLMRD